MVAFDATILLPLLSPGVHAPNDPATGKEVAFFKERIDLLIEELETNRTKIIIPTPALSEILVYADNAGPEYLNRIQQAAVFKIEPFDERAAIEVALMIRDAIKSGDKRSGIREIKMLHAEPSEFGLMRPQSGHGFGALHSAILA